MIPLRSADTQRQTNFTAVMAGFEFDRQSTLSALCGSLLDQGSDWATWVSSWTLLG